MPDDQTLQAKTAADFKGGDQDHSRYLEALFHLGAKEGDRLFDYGCSWGYGSYQMARAGFRVTGYEISCTRADFARNKLGINVVQNFDHLVATEPASFDVFYSSHVLEHLQSPSKLIASALRLLRPGGLFIAFVPNGSEAHRSRNPNWRKLWGEVHPLLIDDVFFRREFQAQKHIIQAGKSLEDYELVVAAIA